MPKIPSVYSIDSSAQIAAVVISIRQTARGEDRGRLKNGEKEKSKNRKIREQLRVRGNLKRERERKDKITFCHPVFSSRRDLSVCRSVVEDNARKTRSARSAARSRSEPTGRRRIFVSDAAEETFERSK